MTAIWRHGAFLLLLLTISARAEGVSIPDTPAGRRFTEIMEVTEDGDGARVREYVTRNFTPSMQRTGPNDPGIVPFLLGHKSSFGGFEVVQVIAAAEEQVVILVRPRNEASRWIRYILKVEATPPHLIEGLFLMPASPGDIPEGPTSMTPAGAIAALSEEIDHAIAARGFSGVVLLAKDGETVLERIAGEADREHRVPVTLETKFGLASMNKMFTALAVGRLVEEGKLSWSDPVGKHLRGWLPSDVEDRTTVRQLLTHTAGLGDYLDQIERNPAIRDARTLAPYQDFARGADVRPLEDGHMQYSNLGYVVLGALIEAVSGMDYFEFIRREIYRPAGMTNSDTWCIDDIVPNRATGYIPPRAGAQPGVATEWRSNRMRQGVRGTSAGGGWSTAGDLLLFAKAMLEGRIVRPETLDEMLAPRVRFPVGGDYAYGFVVHEDREGKRIFGHSGGFAGVDGELKIYGDGQWILIVLANVGGGGEPIVGAWDGIVSQVKE